MSFISKVASRFSQTELPDYEEEVNSVSLPNRKMIQVVLQNNFESKVLKESGFMMLIEGSDLEHIDVNRVIRYECKSDNSDLCRYWSHTKEGVFLVYFDNWNWIIRNHKTNKTILEPGSKLHNEFCELWWSLMYNED